MILRKILEWYSDRKLEKEIFKMMHEHMLYESRLFHKSVKPLKERKDG